MNSSNHSADSQKLSLPEEATGPLPYPLTNDLMFKVILQENPPILKELLAALLHLRSADMQEITILNPYIYGQAATKKNCILDLRILMADQTMIDLEMQVENEGNWPERSIYYLCSNHTRLKQGQSYSDSKPTIQIGILDFNLFPPGENEFYAEHMLTNIRTHRIYSRNLRLNVLNLKQIENATEEDRANGLYDWAKLFLAHTWKELRQMAQKQEVFKETLLAYQKLTAEERLQQELIDRERARMDYESGMAYAEKRGLEQGRKQGLEQGRKLGLQDGKKLGLEQGLITLINILKKLNLSPEEIFRQIRDNETYQDLSDDDILKYLK